ncbi:MAG: hypothetical protein RLZZ383_2135 [Pseudomonadota bacterium]|jgi:hypothetical protein
MGALLGVALGVALTLALLGLGLRRGVRPVATASVYRALAWQHGLRADTRGRSLQGDFHGRTLFLGIDEATQQPVARLSLRHPLGIGLVVRPRTVTERLRRRRQALQTLDAEIDTAFHVAAFDVPTARSLFNDDVRAALLDVRRRAGHVEVSDRRIRLRLRQAPTRRGDAERGLAALERLAAALESARETLPLPPEHAARSAAWAAEAVALGLAHDPRLGAVVGSDIRLQILQVDAAVWIGEAQASIPVTSAFALRIASRRDAAAAFPSAVPTGDSAFDEAFFVSCLDRSRVGDALPQGARRALLALAQTGSVSLQEGRLVWAGWDPARPLAETLAAVQSAVSAWTATAPTRNADLPSIS